ncbi:LOW QUALITY PROTEIN: uncharacterized protein LOC135199038 [Macrobrachium nipponense]|uniref:LOW QUALITY PROTEIN: uncharacterized protein LOC135199038 n=1 Tax=Macrobrachium nipponense TaxID=159736 RepID=UPI0030C7A239
MPKPKVKEDAIAKPKPLKFDSGDSVASWNTFKGQWKSYEEASGLDERSSTERLVTFLRVVGKDAINIYNSFSWSEERDARNIEKVIEKFETLCLSDRSSRFHRYLFHKREQETAEKVDDYVADVRNLAESCGFGDLKETLICDKIIFGLKEQYLKEELLKSEEVESNKVVELIKVKQEEQKKREQAVLKAKESKNQRKGTWIMADDHEMIELEDDMNGEEEEADYEEDRENGAEKGDEDALILKADSDIEEVQEDETAEEGGSVPGEKPDEKQTKETPQQPPREIQKFTSEDFKIELRGLPRYFAMGHLAFGLNPVQAVPGYRQGPDKQKPPLTETWSHRTEEARNEMAKTNPELRQWVKFHKLRRKGQVCEVEEIVPSPQVDGYRNKCEFTIGINPEDGLPTVGFRVSSYKSGSLAVGPVAHLVHIPKAMKDVTKVFQEFVRSSDHKPFDPLTHEGVWRQLTVRTSLHDDILIAVVIHPQEFSEEEIGDIKQDIIVDYFKDGAGATANVTSIFFQAYGQKEPGPEEVEFEHLWGEEYITETVLGKTFRISCESFFQVNTKGCEALYETVASFAELDGTSVILDICCGTGTIGISLADQCLKVYGIEMVKKAAEDARHNADLNGLQNVAIYTGKAEVNMNAVMSQCSRYKTIGIVDPPPACRLACDGSKDKTTNYKDLLKSKQQPVDVDGVISEPRPYVSRVPKGSSCRTVTFLRVYKCMLVGLETRLFSMPVMQYLWV